MNKKDILEIKRRFKKEACTFTRMCGCYVDADHNKITKIGETFLNLEDEEFYKYLEIAKKVLSGTIGNNLLELEFPLAEEAAGGRQQFLMGLRESRLKNDDLMDTFYDMIIDSYDYVGNYLILIFHDAYDVMTKTSDNDKLDESEEVYEYLLCAICPVNLTKPGLGYREEKTASGLVSVTGLSAHRTPVLYSLRSLTEAQTSTLLCFIQGIPRHRIRNLWKPALAAVLSLPQQKRNSPSRTSSRM